MKDFKYKFTDKLEDNPYNLDDVASFILFNRGVEDIESYIETDVDDMYDYHLIDNIEKAVEMIDRHAVIKNKIGILVDCDADGYVSASTIYKYISDNYDVKCSYYIHDSKKHGLGDKVTLEQIINDKLDLLIVPDAGTSDIEEAKSLVESGTDVVVLDHHEPEHPVDATELPYVLVNPMLCEYPNKGLSGGAVVYKTIQAFDDFLFTDEADNFLDVTALTLVSDSMSFMNKENRYITTTGLNNIQHPLFKAMVDAQSYSLNDRKELIADDVAFYIAPLINAMNRVGTMADKEILFRAFCQEYEEFDYKKRGATETVKENIYDRASRLCKNTKARQDKLKKKEKEQAIELVEDCGLNNSEIIVINGEGKFTKELTGLTAMGVADHFGKPVLLGNRSKIMTFDADSETEVESELLQGSVRSIDRVENFKDILEDSGYFNNLIGHQGAMGFTINFNKVSDMIKAVSESVVKKSGEHVDFILDGEIIDEEVDQFLIKDLDNFREYVVNDITKPYFLIADAVIDTSKTDIFGKEEDTIAWVNENEVKYIMFKQGGTELIKKIKESKKSGEYKMLIPISVIGNLNINTYGGLETPQVTVEAFEIDWRNVKKENVDFIANAEIDMDFDEDEEW